MMRQLAKLGFALAAVAACGSSSGGGGGGGGGGNADAPALVGDKYTVNWGPVTVAAGLESTQCIWVRLGNTSEIKVHQLHDTLSLASHHLIVYKDDMDTAEQTTPMPCQPFTGALNTSGMIAPIAITQKHDDEITLPEGVAYTLGANQMVKLEMHYINSTDTDQMVTATTELYAADPTTIHDEASMLFTGSPDIGQDPKTGIQPGTQFTLHQFFTVPSYLDLSSSHIFAITGHEHHLGTGVQVNVAPSKTGPMTSVYDPQPFSWAEPATTTHSPPFSVPVGGGFDFTCSYNNTTTSAAKFGESANDEMCFFWLYYYPSQGSKVCIHTDQYGGANGINACCPGDPTICSLVGNNF